MNKRRETFHKSERLCSQKTIGRLFEEGHVFYCTFFKIVWCFTSSDQGSPAKVAISVSKKGFRLAVTRNLIRRRIKESYRKNKFKLYDFLATSGSKVVFIIIYRDGAIQDYPSIERSVKEMLDKLVLQIRENTIKC